MLLRNVRPSVIVDELDKFIIGQSNAKKAVAVALRSRWRRQQVDKEMRSEITPKNILMTGPTGVGKTEIARRLAKLSGAPFIKVEATKFTEVGFHGRDVDQIIKDLLTIGINDIKKQKKEEKEADGALAFVLDSLIGDCSNDTKYKFINLLEDGELDHVTVKIPLRNQTPKQLKQGNTHFIIQTMREPKTQYRYMTVKYALEYLRKESEDEIPSSEEIIKEAIKYVEENGIVFIDEIDKVCSKKENRYASEASSEGVQRDLLPIIEGTVVNTKKGDVDTSKILFIASGSFYSTKPRDLLPELQGRLPVTVSLDGLNENDIYKILTEPKYNLIVQQQELLNCDGIKLSFTNEAIKELAKLTVQLNRTVENIGARRLHTLIEKITEDISYECKPGEYVIDVNHITNAVKPLFEKADLSRFII